MSYVAAGYAICLGVLCLYAASLVARRRSLERASAVEDLRAGPAGAPAAGTTAAGTTAAPPGHHRPAQGEDGPR